MDYVKVHCLRCNGKFEIYNHSFHHEVRPPVCPHCLARMTDEQWKRLTFAYFTLHDVNKKFKVDNEERGKALFQVETGVHYVHEDEIVMEE